MSKTPILKTAERITIVGGGVTGRAVVETLSRHGGELFLTDNGEIPARTRESLNRLGVTSEEGGHTNEALKSDLLVVSPGVPPDNDLLEEAKSLDIPVIGEIELAHRLSPCKKTVAVTGTNGKTTTVKLISGLLNWAGKNSVACGNIGRPYIKAVKSLNPSDIPVVEVSSYQLQYVERFRSDIAVLLNIEPDHLKRHGTFENYRKAKLKIFENQKKNDCALINRNIEVPEGALGKSKKSEFSKRKVPKIKLPPHQMENLGAAVGVLDCFFREKSLPKIPEEVVKRSLEVPHRLEKIADAEGITVVNDSKATNPSATLAALRSFERPINLLLGGETKEDGYRDLTGSLRVNGVRRVFLFGSGRERLKQLLAAAGFDGFEESTSMKEATEAAVSAARPGELILLSPACASFDAFSDFEERGEVFKKTIRNLIKR